MTENSFSFEDLVPFLVGFILTFLFEVLRYFGHRPGVDA